MTKASSAVASPWQSSTIDQLSCAMITRDFPHMARKDVRFSSVFSPAKSARCGCSSQWNLSRNTTAIRSRRIVGHAKPAGDPLPFGDTSTGINARRLVHSRRVTVESPVSCAAMGVVTKRMTTDRTIPVPNLDTQNGYGTQSCKGREMVVIIHSCRLVRNNSRFRRVSILP